MPELNPPDVPGSPYAKTAAPAPQQKPGDQAYAVAHSKLGCAYVYGATGPNTFDCSGFTQYSYLHGPGIDVGRDTNAQWNNQVTLDTVYDAFALGTTGTANPPGVLIPYGQLTVDKLEVGDLLLYFQPGNSGENAHVRMYAGGGNSIEAPYTGQVVRIVPVDLQGDAREPFRGVKRAKGGGSTGGTAGGGGSSSQGSGSSGPKSIGGSATNQNNDANFSATADLPDPRTNLPFCAAFMGVGGWRFNTLSLRGYQQQSLQIVRGGIVELMAPNASNTGGTFRKGGQFACYFMMNPESIDVSCAVNSDVTNPTQTNQTQQSQAPLWIQQQSITFDLVFNRQYEVWQGGVKGKNGGPGPSDIGVRWDIRALERLMGLYDAKADFGGKGAGYNGQTGLGAYGEGDRAPQALNVQVVFGGQYSYQFQGNMAQLEYEYTMFDADMIPVEAKATVGIMRRYLPMLSSADIVNPLVTQMGQSGTITFPYTQYPHSFNAKLGVVTTKKKGGVWI
jgi:hypothetical protein